MSDFMAIVIFTTGLLLGGIIVFLYFDNKSDKNFENFRKEFEKSENSIK